MWKMLLHLHVNQNQMIMMIHGGTFSRNIIFFCLKIFFTFTNSVDPDEMQHYAAAAFHRGLH